LVKGVRDNLSEEDRKWVDLGLSSLRLPGTSKPLETATTASSSPEQAGTDQATGAPPSQRYLGEASDIRFFHTIELAFCQRAELDQGRGLPKPRVDSYEQEGASQRQTPEDNHAVLPHRVTADSFLDIYFSTIHLAYPFIWQPTFRETYESFWQSDSLDSFRGPWLALLCESMAKGQPMLESPQLSPPADVTSGTQNRAEPARMTKLS
jgi:hypothetical protein